MEVNAAIDGDIMRIDKQTGDRIAKMGLAAKGKSSAAQIDKVAEEFEAQFISQMLENMFATIPVSEELGGGFGEEMYRSLIVNEYGKIISQTGGVGMADHVKREILRTQEVE